MNQIFKNIVSICLGMFLILGFYAHAFAQIDSIQKVTLPELKVPALKNFDNSRVTDTVVQDSASVLSVPKVFRKRIDSATLARMNYVTDSIQKLVLYVPKYKNYSVLIDSVEKQILVKGELNLLTLFKDKKKFKPENTYYKVGSPLPKGSITFPLIVVFLLLFFIILRQYHGKQLFTIIRAFYSNHWLIGLGKDNNLMNSWLFLFMFLFFGFITGLFLCLTSRYFKLSYPIEGFALWGIISGTILLFVAIKLLITTMIGFIFDVPKIVSEYVSIQYLAYFNVAIVFLPLIVFFCFSPLSFGRYYISIGAVFIALVFITQILRAGINIMSQHKLGKFYLLLYICALEICPVLIIIKALAY